MPATTILLPAYNAAPTLEAAVSSLLAQTDPDFELVAVDDGSTDATPALLAAFAAADPRVRVLTRPHRGLVAALNDGLEAARGRYVARMDADDWCAPTRLARQRAALEADAGLAAVGCLVEHRSAGLEASAGYAHHVDWLNGLVTPEAIALNRFVESPLAHPSVMFRRELIDRHGPYLAGDFPEDYELWLRWLAAGERIGKVEAPLLVWHDGPNRLSRTHPAYAVEAFYRLKARYLARWLEAHNPRHPELLIWGSGKTSKQRAEHLVAAGCRIVGYIDIDPRRRGRTAYGRPIWGPEDVTGPDFGFVVSYVGVRGAGDFIRGQLRARGYLEGRHFLLAA